MRECFVRFGGGELRLREADLPVERDDGVGSELRAGRAPAFSLQIGDAPVEVRDACCSAFGAQTIVVEARVLARVLAVAASWLEIASDIWRFVASIIVLKFKFAWFKSSIWTLALTIRFEKSIIVPVLAASCASAWVFFSATSATANPNTPRRGWQYLFSYS